MHLLWFKLMVAWKLNYWPINVCFLLSDSQRLRATTHCVMDGRSLELQGSTKRSDQTVEAGNGGQTQKPTAFPLPCEQSFAEYKQSYLLNCGVPFRVQLRPSKADSEKQSPDSTLETSSKPEASVLTSLPVISAGATIKTSKITDPHLASSIRNGKTSPAADHRHLPSVVDVENISASELSVERIELAPNVQ